ncbi:hypothetical protein RJ641_012812 [Dillenia turbinata]|uniref:Uncharacterized protein n=1 Tax=Dillenia turbinata TaxID=194707 RepID=A0AAN8Z4F9_9MAGN
MATGVGDEDADAVLSDVEADDDPAPIAISSPSQEEEDVSVERLREILAELERERQAREAAESSKSDLQTQFNRLKVLAHEAIKKRDESTRLKDEALREKEEALRSNERLLTELSEANKVRDEYVQQIDSIRSEMNNAEQMMVTGIEKISRKLSSFKDFSAGGFPRYQKYSGLPAIAYGVIKRTNEIVEEMLKQIETTTKSRNDAREQMEQRNYEIAIEVSQLEATISGLREEVAKKSSAVENLEKVVAEKEMEKSEMEREMAEKLRSMEKESLELKELVSEYDNKSRSLEAKIDAQKPLLSDQLNFVSKIHEQMYSLISLVDDDSNMDQHEFSESLFLPQETDLEENIRASLAGMDSIYELTKIVIVKTKDMFEERKYEAKKLHETVSQLVKEKEQIGSLLRSTLSKRMKYDPSSKTSELFEVAENGLRESGIKIRFSNILERHDKAGTPETADDEVYTLAGALEKIVKESQVEILELKRSVDELRASRLRERLEELTRQLEESDTREESRRHQNAHRYLCWPWDWLGINFVASRQTETQLQNSNEMELSEPLL